MYILGINCAYHESSACLIKNGRIIVAVEEERFNRVKHSKPARVNNPDELPIHSIDYCLKTAGIKLKDIDRIGFSFNPEKRLKNIGVDKFFVEGSWGSESGEKLFYQKIKTIPEKLNKIAGCDISKKFHWIDHHLCHATSSFFVSPFKESAILVIDGIGEFATCWIGYGKNNKIYKTKEICYPNSLGFLWEKMCQFLGFSEYDACKVMGLSSYGEDRKLMTEMRKIIKINQNGTFEINNDILRFRTPDFSQLEKLFKTKKRNKNTNLLEVHKNIAASLQKITEEVLTNLANKLYQHTKSKNICLAGGVALNCVANAKIVSDTNFKNIFVQPAANDAGTALGAALYIWNQLLNKPRTLLLKNAYLGPKYHEREIIKVLEENKLEYKKIKNIEKHTALLLSRGKIIAWFQGRMEFGPRALGHRSILADPRNPAIREELNQKVKFREVFRPFCPSVLEKNAKGWFEIEKLDLPAYYMLMTYKVKPEKVKLIPAVTHIDNSARIQLVSQKTDKKYYNLINEFKKISGIPVILNTSFNIQEPIVCSPEDAINTFERSKIDYLIIDNFIINHNSLKAQNNA